MGNILAGFLLEAEVAAQYPEDGSIRRAQKCGEPMDLDCFVPLNSSVAHLNVSPGATSSGSARTREVTNLPSPREALL